MKHYLFQKHVKNLNSAACFLFCIFLIMQTAQACSWDYLIWMNQSQSADPVYRFVQKGMAGYIDQTGKILFQPKFKAYGNYGWEFHDGLLEIGVSSGKYSDLTGSLVIDKDFDRGWEFSEGLAVAMEKNSNRWGYIDRVGRFVIHPKFDTYPEGYVYSFSDGVAMINVAKKYGYIDRSGKFVIQPNYLHGTDFHEGFARVVTDGPCTYFGEGPCPDFQTLGKETKDEEMPTCKFTFINKLGSIISSIRFDGAKEFSEGFAPVRIERKWGFIDQKGKLVIEAKFDMAEPFSDGLAQVRQGELFGYIGHNGKYVIAPQFEYAVKFSDGLAAVSNSRNEQTFQPDSYYYINKLGNQAIKERFSIASYFFKGIAHVKLISAENSEGEFAYINTSGRKIFTYPGER